MLRERDSKLIQKIVRAGLERSAQAFSTILGEKIKASSVFLVEEKSIRDYFRRVFSNEKAYYLVITKVSGELEAESFLMFDKDNATILFEKILSDSDIKDRSMRESLLLEVDNILAASVVTEFANHLDMKAYGNVPILECAFSQDIQEKLQNKLELYPKSCFFKADFSSEHTRIEVEFLWLFYSDFLEP